LPSDDFVTVPLSRWSLQQQKTDGMTNIAVNHFKTVVRLLIVIYAVWKFLISIVESDVRPLVAQGVKCFIHGATLITFSMPSIIGSASNAR